MATKIKKKSGKNNSSKTAKKVSTPKKKKPTSKPAKKSKPSSVASKKAELIKKKPILTKASAAKPAKGKAVAPISKNTGKLKAVLENKPAPAKSHLVAPISKGKVQVVSVNKPLPKASQKKEAKMPEKQGLVVSKEEIKNSKPEETELQTEEMEALEAERVDGPEEEIIEEEHVEEKVRKPRGRAKKVSRKHYDSEDFVRKQIVKIDLTKPLIKKPKKVEPVPFINLNDNRSRYSDKELAEFKAIIDAKLEEAKADYELQKQTITNADNHGTDDTSPTFKLLEDGSDMLSKEEMAQLAVRQEKYIVNLQNALVRIQNKSYGICRVTGKLIPKERLKSVPHATLSIDAKLSQYS